MTEPTGNAAGQWEPAVEISSPGRPPSLRALAAQPEEGI